MLILGEWRIVLCLWVNVRRGSCQEVSAQATKTHRGFRTHYRTSLWVQNKAMIGFTNELCSNPFGWRSVLQWISLTSVFPTTALEKLFPQTLALTDCLWHFQHLVNALYFAFYIRSEITHHLNTFSDIHITKSLLWNDYAWTQNKLWKPTQKPTQRKNNNLLKFYTNFCYSSFLHVLHFFIC